jgi:hypothetical protein
MKTTTTPDIPTERNLKAYLFRSQILARLRLVFQTPPQTKFPDPGTVATSLRTAVRQRLLAAGHVSPCSQAVSGHAGAARRAPHCVVIIVLWRCG